MEETTVKTNSPEDEDSYDSINDFIKIFLGLACLVSGWKIFQTVMRLLMPETLEYEGHQILMSSHAADTYELIIRGCLIASFLLIILGKRAGVIVFYVLQLINFIILLVYSQTSGDVGSAFAGFIVPCISVGLLLLCQKNGKSAWEFFFGSDNKKVSRRSRKTDHQSPVGKSKDAAGGRYRLFIRHRKNNIETFSFKNSKTTNMVNENEVNNTGNHGFVGEGKNPKRNQRISHRLVYGILGTLCVCAVVILGWFFGGRAHNDIGINSTQTEFNLGKHLYINENVIHVDSRCPEINNPKGEIIPTKYLEMSPAQSYCFTCTNDSILSILYNIDLFNKRSHVFFNQLDSLGCLNHGYANFRDRIQRSPQTRKIILKILIEEGIYSEVVSMENMKIDLGISRFSEEQYNEIFDPYHEE